MSSFNSSAVRWHIVGFGLYGIAAAIGATISPNLLLEFPILPLVERLTGLPHMNSPQSEAEKQFFACALMFAFAIGLIYLFMGTLYWRRMGVLWAQFSVFGRVIMGSIMVVFCLFTNSGTSLLFTVGLGDIVTGWFTRRALRMSWSEIVGGK